MSLEEGWFFPLGSYLCTSGFLSYRATRRLRDLMEGSCAMFSNTSFCFLFGFSHHLEKSTLKFNGPSGKSSSSWENVKSLSLPEGTRGED